MWVKSKTSTVDAYRKRARNLRALVLFGRSVMTTLAVISGALGFYTGIRIRQSSYDPYAYATGVGALFAAACAVIAFMMIRRHFLLDKLHKAEAHAEELTDRNWELREAAEHARSLLEAQGDLIVRRDAQGRVSYVNDAFCMLIGRARAELIGQPLDLPLLQQGEIMVLADGTRLHDQKIASGDAARWIAWREVAVRSETGNEVQSVGRDVTDRRRAEDQAQRNLHALAHAGRVHSMGEMASTLAHELTQPLTAILSFSQASRRVVDNDDFDMEELRFALERISTNARRAGDIVSHMREFIRKEEPRVESTDINALVLEAVDLLNSELTHQAVELERAFDCGLAEVAVDPVQIQQVVVNLLRNAIEAMEYNAPGQRRIRLGTGTAGRHHIHVTVADTGPGLAPHIRDVLFETFVTTKRGGMGIGLSICKSIVEAHGGELRVGDTDGGGANFEITLPTSVGGEDP